MTPHEEIAGANRILVKEDQEELPNMRATLKRAAPVCITQSEELAAIDEALGQLAEEVASEEEVEAHREIPRIMKVQYAARNYTSRPWTRRSRMILRNTARRKGGIFN